MPKVFKGEKYIYLLMAYKLAKQNNGRVKIGNDNSYVGEQNYERIFSIQDYNNRTLLIEKKTSRCFADFSRVFEITNFDKERPTIKEYYNEAGENGSDNWVH